MHNFIEYSDSYSKASGSLWLYCRDKLALTDAGAADNFPGNRYNRYNKCCRHKKY